jgi:hypothetical protein
MMGLHTGHDSKVLGIPGWLFPILLLTIWPLVTVLLLSLCTPTK